MPVIKFLFIKKSLGKHLNACRDMPEIIYKLENKNIQTFFDNIKFMGDLPFQFILTLKQPQARKLTILMKTARLSSFVRFCSCISSRSEN